MNSNIRNFMLVAAVFVAGYANGQKDGYEVEYAGQLREIMHQNNISAKVAIDSLLTIPDLFAVGALDSLSGEILVDDGILYVSKVAEETVSLSKVQNAHAALLVYTYVKEWKEVHLPDNLTSMEGLEVFLDHLAKTLDTNEILPFRLTGIPESVHFHVIRPLGPDATHEARKAAGFSGTMTGEEVSIVGFYSDRHHGVFTHHDSNIHMHVRNSMENMAGHVDGIQLGGNVQLYIPVK